MKNKDISELVAADMNARLQSEENVSLFNGVYKLAGEKCEKCHCVPCDCDCNDAKKMKMCKECHCSPCECDMSKADDNDARSKKEMSGSSESSSSSSSSSSSDTNSAADIWAASDSKVDMSDDKCDADDGDVNSSNDMDKGRYDTNGERYGDVLASLDEAFANLLNASAALDAIGFDKSASLSLNLANFLVEAKKKVEDKKSKKSKSKSSDKSSSKSKSSKDMSDTKAKKKMEDSKDSKSSKKPNPFAKKK
jgi:hypothetical protein